VLRFVGNKRATLWLSLSGSNPFSSEGSDVNKLKLLMLLGLMLFSASSSRTVAQVAKDAAMPGIHEIQVTLKKYEFDPGTLRVKRGERVRLILAAADHDHGFKLDEFDVDQKVQRGTAATVEFVADKAGTFQFRCSSVCGLGHRGMKGTLVVED
jgi:cytochrome c oxidase subunit 2